MNIAYFGFNDPRQHARGVEFVILAQAQSASRAYYLFLGTKQEVFRWRHMICISVQKGVGWPVALNALIYRLGNRRKVTLIHAHNYLMAAVSIKRPDLFTVHDGLAYLKTAFGRPSKVFAWIEDWVYRRARRVHFISKFALSMARPIGARRPHFVLYNTCTREILKESGEARLDGVAWQRPYGLIVRGIEARAGLDLVLDVGERLQKEKVNFDIVIAGKGPLLDHYRSKVSERGLVHVHLLGYVDDVALARLYQQAQLVINPALYGEGFGLPVVEAYFFGKRALASDVCALPEIVMTADDLFENSVDDLWRSLVSALREASESSRDEAVVQRKRRDYYLKTFGAEKYRSDWSAIYRKAYDELA